MLLEMSSQTVPDLVQRITAFHLVCPPLHDLCDPLAKGQGPRGRGEASIYQLLKGNKETENRK